MNNETRIVSFRTNDDREIAAFLQNFGKDLVAWTHTSGAVGSNSRYLWHFVIARVSDMYGEFEEDDRYVPFE